MSRNKRHLVYFFISPFSSWKFKLFPIMPFFVYFQWRNGPWGVRFPVRTKSLFAMLIQQGSTLIIFPWFIYYILLIVLVLLFWKFCLLCNNILLSSWQIRFIDNTDPAGIDHQIAQLGPELASTLVIVISKVSSEIKLHKEDTFTSLCIFLKFNMVLIYYPLQFFAEWRYPWN